MKRLLLILVFLPLLAFGKGPEIKFSQTTKEMGNIQEKGGVASTVFEFVNTGDAPLVILSAKASCGCTKATFPDEPIAPGAKASIKVTYNPDGRAGEFVKTVLVKSNSVKNGSIRLKIKGCVIPSGK